MNTLRARITRLTAASVLALGLGVLAAGPASAENPAGFSSSSTDSVTLAADDGAGTDRLCTIYTFWNCLA